VSASITMCSFASKEDRSSKVALMASCSFMTMIDSFGGASRTRWSIYWQALCRVCTIFSVKRPSMSWKVTSGLECPENIEMLELMI
jgi:hypothetical protein